MCHCSWQGRSARSDKASQAGRSQREARRERRRRKRGREEGRKGGRERRVAGRSPGKDAAGKAVRMQQERSELCDSGSEGKEGGEMEERGGTEEKDGRGCAPARAPLTRVQRARKAKAASDKAAKAR